ncbi:hypothetical protein HDU97_008048 [Phlyctochytrium planicorne]|nr:hypothetical protein HDU97_008048 [Phlyctochytrium planicorne]
MSEPSLAVFQGFNSKQQELARQAHQPVLQPEATSPAVFRRVKARPAQDPAQPATPAFTPIVDQTAEPTAHRSQGVKRGKENRYPYLLPAAPIAVAMAVAFVPPPSALSDVAATQD